MDGAYDAEASTAHRWIRTELVGTDLSLETATWRTDDPWAPPRPGFVGRLHLGHETDVVDPVPVTFVVDGVAVEPRVLSHTWSPDLTETVYGLTDSLRVAERKGVRGAVLCADWHFLGEGRVEVRPSVPRHIRARVTTVSVYADLRVDIPVRSTPIAPVKAPGTVRFRVVLGDGEPIGDLDARPFEAWLARHAPRLHTGSKELAEVYRYRWFVVYRNLRRPFLWFKDHPMPGELFFEGPVSNWFTAPIGLSFPLQLREARWMRSPRGVQDTLNAWTANAGALRSYAADPLTPAIEFAEHHPLQLGAARDAALEYVLGTGRSARLAGGNMHSFPTTIGSWVNGTEYAPDFFAEAGWDHTRSEMFIEPPALPRAGAPDSPQADRLTRVSRVDTNVWHWAMVKALGGPDLRTELARTHLHNGYFRSVGEHGPIKSVLNFEAALPFLYADFGPQERSALARAIDAWSAPKGLYSTAPDCPEFSPDNAFRGYSYPCCWNGPVWNYATSWVLHALGAVAERTSEPALRERFARVWTQWTASHLALGEPLVVEHFHPRTGRPYRLIPDYFHSAWLDTFFRHVVLKPLVDAGPLLVEGVPYKETEVNFERGVPGARG
ncbi:MGH1-like glycoside hydrolase domain-containing protein [Solirubrobacter soli]|uniref:MGH1-like glycoside hydrolase domain-containing protein n=1 Tax=Solirubrobacter soli TaxID=363832 RepID=UPI0004872D8B|nr:hypothetical protein [Solirubrobacter soli]